jgi:hypothetical protein
MLKILTGVLLGSLTIWVGVASPQEREQRGGSITPPWKLSDLKVTLRGGSATMETFGKYGAQPVLRLQLKAGARKLEPVFLELADDKKDYAKKAEAFRYEPVPGKRTRSKILFKSKELAARVRNYRGALTVDAQLVSAEMKDGRWKVTYTLTDAARKTLTIK